MIVGSLDAREPLAIWTTLACLAALLVRVHCVNLLAESAFFASTATATAAASSGSRDKKCGDGRKKLSLM